MSAADPTLVPDLIAAGTNALNGAILVRRPDHFRGYTIVGVVLLAVVGGIGGGVTRDVILGAPVASLMDPLYLIVCVGVGILGLLLPYAPGQLMREGVFQTVTSASLPWYAIVGAQKAVEHGYPALGALVIGVIATTAGRLAIDLISGVPPKHFVQGEWYITTAIGTAGTWLICHAAGLPVIACTIIAFCAGFAFRLCALFLGWEEPVAAGAPGGRTRPIRRPRLGRKIFGRSKQELRDLGLSGDGIPSDEKERPHV